MYQSANQPPYYSEKQPQQQQPTQYGIPPGSQQQMTVVVTQPQQNNMMVTGLQGHRDWSSDLFGCFEDMGSCLLTCFCYPVSLCMISQRLGEFVCLPCCVPGADIMLRTRIRSIGGIQGSMCNDCVIVACCGACAACQEARELDKMGL